MMGDFNPQHAIFKINRRSAQTVKELKWYCQPRALGTELVHHIQFYQFAFSYPVAFHH
jgi:hypothetical protein